MFHQVKFLKENVQTYCIENVGKKMFFDWLADILSTHFQNKVSESLNFPGDTTNV
jgi:hypothetical protein